MVFLYLQIDHDSTTTTTTSSKPQFQSQSQSQSHVVKDKFCVLHKVQSCISSQINNTPARYEARLWLRNTISAFHSLNPPSDQCLVFRNLLDNKAYRKDVAPQLLHLIFQTRPHLVGPIIAKRCHLLNNFFLVSGNNSRILQWFDNFSISSESGHRKGSRALSQFAFANRNTCWDELEWRGAHGQSPAVIATKPHYFQNLDVLRTVQNFLEYVPAFWSSDELTESVKGGDILEIDRRYFVNLVLDLMYEERCRDVWDMVEGFLSEERFSSLCPALLASLDVEGLFYFLRSLGKFLKPNLECKELKFSCCWLEILLSRSFSLSLDQVLLMNSVISKPRQLFRLISDEENKEEEKNLEDIVGSLVGPSNEASWALTRELMEMKREEAVKWIAIQSWILFYILTKECKTPESLELVFLKNGIDFREANEHSFVGSDDSDVETFERRSRKRRKRDKKKKRKVYDFDFGEDKDDQSLEFEFQSSARSWFLSTDGFSFAWNMADVPEHLCMYYLKTWIKQVLSE
ncbi:hypothetical protein LUZ63_012707 [Rhynchospora breviuscula]|uniref:Uncharacterized protein n=1 Tax=Rhynchospora breviuscula TaxID=2022672 RepID=A0A9Q0CL53_9POAL|nr:hypothetical protein LUZ63_012707 [Rhynchospora breviuscula]